MSLITVNNKQVDIDIRAELEQYDWTRAKWSHEKLLAASPFRYDNQPSFYVYLEDTTSAPAGSFGDSGAVDDYYAKGGFVKLLAFLRNEDEQSTVDYLLSTYDENYEREERPLSLFLRDTDNSTLDKQLIDKYTYTYIDYLKRRRISEKVVQTMNIRYIRELSAIAIPWYNSNGTLCAVKYRRTDSKTFWYAENGTPIRELVYGINRIYDKKASTAIICEAEIDALTFMSAGYDAVATGGATFNEIKRDIIAKSPIETLIICADNDDAGEGWKYKVTEMMSGYCKIGTIVLPEDVKDANELAIKLPSFDKFTETIERVTAYEPLVIKGFTL